MTGPPVTQRLTHRIDWAQLRCLIEPLLWVAAVIGLVWMATALDAVLHVGDQDLGVSAGITLRSAWSTLALFPSAGVALLAWSLERRGTGRVWCALTGVALIGTSFGWSDIENMGWLKATSIVVGVLCLILAPVRPAWAARADEPKRPWPVLLVALLTTPLIAVGALGAQAGFAEGLVSAPPAADTGWSHLILGLLGLVLGCAAMIRLLQARSGGAVATFLLAGGAVMGTLLTPAAVVGGVVSIGVPVQTDPPPELAFGFVSYAIVLAALAGWAWYLLAFKQPTDKD